MARRLTPEKKAENAARRAIKRERWSASRPLRSHREISRSGEVQWYKVFESWEEMADFLTRPIGPGTRPKRGKAPTRPWITLTPTYRKRLERAGIHRLQYEWGQSRKAARGHGTTPEHPGRLTTNRLHKYMNVPCMFIAASREGNVVGGSPGLGGSGSKYQEGLVYRSVTVQIALWEAWQYVVQSYGLDPRSRSGVLYWIINSRGTQLR